MTDLLHKREIGTTSSGMLKHHKLGNAWGTDRPVRSASSGWEVPPLRSLPRPNAAEDGNAQLHGEASSDALSVNPVSEGDADT